MLGRIARGVTHRFKQLTFRPHVINRRICGEEIRFLIGDLFGAGWYGQQHDPWPELQWIKDNGIRLGDTVVDCGANHGFSSVLFSKWTGSTGEVHAIEPTAHNVEILRKNLHLNEVKNVIVHEIAAGEINGTIMLTDHPNAAVTQDISRKVVSASVRRLDDEFSKGGVDFIKIDVEGHELEVLRGAARLIGGRPRLALELHVCMYREPTTTLDSIFGVLRACEYSIAVQPIVDGPIEPLNKDIHTLKALAQCEVVHLFCK